jgi:coenzyme F420-reducing hydrogenase delta subunit
MARRTLAVVALALLLALAGCSGLGGTQSDGPDADTRNADGAVEGDAGGNGNGAAGGDQSVATGDDGVREYTGRQPARERQLIRTGEIRLRVDDGAATGEAVRALATDRGGFVAESTVEVHERHNETWRSARIVLRVPSGDFDATVAGIESMGEVRNAQTGTEDVTDQLVDIEARLENLRAERDRLRTLYEQANETEDVLAVQRELADVQEEIERLEARKASLEQDVAYSTITVHLEERPPDAPEPEPEPAWYQTGLLAAFLQSVDGVVTTVRALAVAGAYLAPYVLVFGTPLVGGAVALRRWRG